MAGTIATAKILVITTLQKSRPASKPANDRIQWLKLAKKLSLLQARDARDRLAELELQRRLEAMSAPEQAIARFKSLASDQQQSLLRYNHPLRVEPGAQRGFVKLVREGMTEDQTDIVSGKHGSYPAMAYEMAHAGFPQVTPN